MAPEKELRTAQVNLRLRPSLKAALEQAAEAENRSVNSLIEWIATTYLQEHGHLPGGTTRKPRK